MSPDENMADKALPVTSRDTRVLLTGYESLSTRQKERMTSSRSVVVNASDCGSQGFGFESHQSRAVFFSLCWFLPRAGSAMGPVGRLEPHSLSLIHI